MAVCKSCFKGSFHNHHKFIVKRAPDLQWEAAQRGDGPSDYEIQFRNIMNDLEQREITPDDYDLLLQLENQKNQGNLAKYMVLNYVDDDS